MISSVPGANGLLTQQELNTDGTSHAYDVPRNVDRTFPLSPAKTKAMELYWDLWFNDELHNANENPSSRIKAQE